jgi:hypothetical protein
VILYLVLAIVLALQSPGLQYDEALMAHGAVHILTGMGEPTFAHDRGSWVNLGSRWFPLMVIPYVGATKHYLLLVPFALFGPQVLILRLLSAMLAAFGIWGLSGLLRQEVGALPAAAMALVLAVHPAYLQQTVFDSTGVSMWMGSLGLVCLALARYLRRPAMGAAFMLGIACGFAVWARLNFIWFLGAGATAALLVSGRRAVKLPRHILPVVVGGIVGGAPVVAYEFLSRFATLRFMNAYGLKDPLAKLLPVRFFQFSELLVSDGELRAIWAGPPIPDWQRLVFSLVLLGSIVVALLVKDGEAERAARWRRGFALALLLFVGVMVTSSMNVLQHHLVTALPLAIGVAVLAFQAIVSRLRLWRYVAAVVGAFCISVMVYWDVSAVLGLQRTGGVNYWSDAIFTVADTVVRKHVDQPVKVLDWGLGNNLYVLGRGQIRVQELFWGATVEGTASGERWSDLIARGGVFLTGGDRSLKGAFAPALEGFREALVRTGAAYQVTLFRERGGAVFAELVEVAGAASSHDQAIRGKAGLRTAPSDTHQGSSTPLPWPWQIPARSPAPSVELGQISGKYYPPHFVPGR